MTLCHLTIFPVKAGSTFLQDQTGDHQQTNLTAYQCLIKKLIYLKFEICPNISFIIGQLNRHNANLWIKHLHMAKEFLRYLKITITLGIE